MGKPELTLMHLDAWMLRWRHYQSHEDWQVEVSRQKRRQFDIGVALFIAGSASLYTTSIATGKRWFSAPHFFDIGVDVAVKTFIRDKIILGHRRYTPGGYGRLAIVALPTYFTFVSLEHWAESSRLQTYLAADTVFGEQARRFVSTGKIEEFLPINIKAPVPNNEKVIYGEGV